MNWFKKKIYPSYWNDYLDCFKTEQSDNIENLRFVVFDTETTGLDIKKDRILSIGTIAVVGNTLKVADSLDCYVSQDIFNAETVKIHGLLKKGNHQKLSEEEAIIQFLVHIKNAVLVAHHAAFDIAMINQALKRLKLPKLKNKVLDTGHLYNKTNPNSPKKHFSLDELSAQFKIPQHDRHSASGDAFITALLLVKLITVLKKQACPPLGVGADLTLNYLLRSNTRTGLL